MVKIKVSISMEDSLFEEVKKKADNSNGSFRNKSHLIELAVKKFLENKEINEGGNGK